MSCSCRLITSRSVTGFDSNAQTSYATAGCANVSAVLLVDNTCKKFSLLQYGVDVFRSSESIRQSVHIVLQKEEILCLILSLGFLSRYTTSLGCTELIWSGGSSSNAGTGLH